jgi:hypothetical protein
VLLSEADEIPQWKKYLETVLDGVWLTTLMTIITVWALFGDDIRLIATYKESDDAFGALALVALLAFTIELGKPQK